MKKLWLVFGSCALLNISWAYEVQTHEAMSEKSVEASILFKDKTVLSNIGIKDIKQTFPNSQGDDKDIIELFRNGARFEDNLLLGTVLRVRHHFFDPLYNRPLTILGIAAGEKSPDWALEDLEDIGSQAFSFRHARDYLYKALTLPSEQERKKNFGLTFQTLGHVIHHIQDMAQPQHVRNDIHPSIGAHKSLYEEYTDGHRGELSYTADSVMFPRPRDFWTNANNTGLAQFTNRNFVSAGTNFQLSSGQPAANSVYPQPRPAGGETPVDIQQLFAAASLPPPRDQDGNLLRGDIVFVGSNVDGVPNPRASTLSIFDQDLKAYNKTITYDADPLDPTFGGQVTVDRLFTFNQFNFRAAYPFLIPKAVGYSAGLIDYFFRGQLSAEDVTFTDTGITLKVKNAIDSQKTPAWQNEVLYAKTSGGSAGSLVVAFDYKDSVGKTQYGVSNTVPVRATDTLAAGQVSAGVYDFTLTVPSEAKDVNYRLVFRGKLGQEDDAVAVGKVEPSSGFLVTPNYLPADGIPGSRAIRKQGGAWRLSDKEGLQAGNIDWKGWYVNGKPTKVLSWWGTRFFPAPIGYATFQRMIYQDGEEFAMSPYDVLGAAIYPDNQGKEWLIAVCRFNNSDIVLRRPNKKNLSPGFYDPITAPEGWQQLASRQDSFTADHGWFFNGPGTEAQTMRRTDSFNVNKLTRLKLTISGESARFDNLGNDDGITRTVTVSDSKWNNLPPTNPALCSAGNSGAATRTRTVQTTETGEYVIAVDYDDTKEVLARITGSGTDINTREYRIDWTILRDNCARTTGNLQDKITVTHGIQRKLTINTLEIPLDSDPGTRMLNTTYSRPSPPFSQNWFDYGDTDLSVKTATGGVVIPFRIFDPYHVDMRYNLYASHQYSRQVEDTIAVNEQQICFNESGDTLRKDVVFFNSKLLTATERTFPPFPPDCSPRGNNPFPAILNGFYNFSELATNKVIPRLDRNNKISGSWAVDSNKNLAVSQQTFNAQEPVFNYLTDGDFKTLIPIPTHDFPLYGPMVIK